MKKLFVFLAIAFLAIANANFVLATDGEHRMAVIKEHFLKLENGVVNSTSDEKVTTIMSSAVTSEDTKRIVGGAETRISNKINVLEGKLSDWKQSADQILKNAEEAAKINLITAQKSTEIAEKSTEAINCVAGSLNNFSGKLDTLDGSIKNLGSATNDVGYVEIGSYWVDKFWILFTLIIITTLLILFKRRAA